MIMNMYLLFLHQVQAHRQSQLITSNYTTYVEKVNTRQNAQGSLDTSYASGDEMPVHDTNGNDQSGTYTVSALGLLMFNEDATSNVNSNIWQDGGSEHLITVTLMVLMVMLLGFLILLKVISLDLHRMVE